MISQGLAWKVGNGRELIIGLDPWLGFENGHILPWNLRELLAQHNIHDLFQVVDEDTTSIWK